MLSARPRRGALALVATPRLPVAIAVALIAAGSVLITGVTGAAAVPPDDPPRGLVHAGLRQDQPGGPCKGAFILGDGRKGPPRCFHGPDPAPPGIDVRVSQAPRAATPETGPSTAAAHGAVQCYGDGVSGPRVQLVYARAADRADRYATYLATFRQIAAQVDDVFVHSALETGGVRHVRYVTDSSCVVSVANVVLSASGDDNIENTANELEARGFNRTDRKYLVWMDANVYCGIAEIWPDDRPTADNYNNGRPGVPGMVARVDSGCWGLSGANLVEAHELMHNLGGVQSSAPHGTAYNHCTDDHDRMCYPDGSGEPMSVVCPSGHEALFDCNHEDYFHTRPAAGTYLATRWNAARSAFLAPTDSISGWGYNAHGGLGNGTTVDATSPVQVPGVTGVGAIAAGTSHSLAVRPDGTVLAWGDNSYGQLGDGTLTTRATPWPVAGLTGVTAVSGGLYHSLALRSDGTVWAWGWNATGQLGDGTTVDRRTAVQVVGLSGITAISAGGLHNLARRFDGTVWAWGWNVLGQLGDGTNVDRLRPVPVPGLTGVTGVATGVYHSLALRGTDGSVRAWGWNHFGQLGDGTRTDRWSPVTVAGQTGMVSIAAGFHHSLARSGAGYAVAWGWNGHGQLGDGTTTDRPLAVRVPNLPTGVAALTAGGYHSLAINGAGTVAAWGWNYFGQLGDGTTIGRLVPTAVAGPLTARKLAGGGLHTLAA
ncbi:MAG TPA: hypothetical protein VHF00_04425 [Acidimicrobiales bacterium]|nr:hypothetical protein [Acidimicrobiales bacterium]